MFIIPNKINGRKKRSVPKLYFNFIKIFHIASRNQKMNHKTEVEHREIKEAYGRLYQTNGWQKEGWYFVK